MLNSITIMGRLTADPEITETRNGTKVLHGRIACDRGYGEKKTDFVNFVAWRERAEFVSKNFSKGMPILLLGRLQINEWEKDGVKHRDAEIVVSEANFCGGEKRAPANANVDDQFSEFDDDDGFDDNPFSDVDGLPL